MPEADRLLGLARGVGQHALLAERHELGDAVGLDVALAREAEVPLDVDLDPQALAVEAVLLALVLAEHGVEALEEVLVGPAPGVVDAHRVVGRDRPVEEAPVRPAGVLGAQPRERPALPPLVEDVVLLRDEIGLRCDGSEHAPPGCDRRAASCRRPAGDAVRRVRVSYPRCSDPGDATARRVAVRGGVPVPALPRVSATPTPAPAAAALGFAAPPVLLHRAASPASSLRIDTFDLRRARRPARGPDRGLRRQPGRCSSTALVAIVDAWSRRRVPQRARPARRRPRSGALAGRRSSRSPGSPRCCS